MNGSRGWVLRVRAEEKRSPERREPPRESRTAAVLRAAAIRPTVGPGAQRLLGASQRAYSPQVNAYATVGGRIQVFEGLLRELYSEEALAALLAHEIAHVKHRHVAAGLGRGLAVALLLSMVSADAGATTAQATLGSAATFTLLGYSRDQEAQADEEAMQAVVALYGHAGGLVELFTVLGKVSSGTGPKIEALNSHPLTDARRAAVHARALERGWATSGAITPLSGVLRTTTPR